jgi:hypothetical protein
MLCACRFAAFYAYFRRTKVDIIAFACSSFGVRLPLWNENLIRYILSIAHYATFGSVPSIYKRRYDVHASLHAGAWSKDHGTDMLCCVYWPCFGHSG